VVYLFDWLSEHWVLSNISYFKLQQSGKENGCKETNYFIKTQTLLKPIVAFSSSCMQA